MSSPRPWWQSVSLSSPELDTLRAQYKHLCEPIKEEPGWFAVRDGVNARFQGHLLDPGDRPIYFSLFDPDIRGLPFHRTAAFLTVPYPYRFAFLCRNPHCIDALLRLFRASHTLANRRHAEGGLIRAGLEGENLLDAESELRDRFGIRPIWTHRGTFIDPPILSLEEAFPGDLPTLGRTERERRCFRKSLAARRRAGGLELHDGKPTATTTAFLRCGTLEKVGWISLPKATTPNAPPAPAALGSEGWCGQPCNGLLPRLPVRHRPGVQQRGVAGQSRHLLAPLQFGCDSPAGGSAGKKGGRRPRRDERVVHFLRLLQKWHRHRRSRTSGRVVRASHTLPWRSPDNWDAVREFMQCPERVSELFASLCRDSARALKGNSKG